jgi:hypothetical protein
MTDVLQPQSILFQRIKQSISPHLSLAENVAEILNISSDSAYRRIRNEKKLELDEFYILCNHFKISADDIFNFDSQFVKFNFLNINEENFDFDHFIEAIYVDLKRLFKEDNPKIYCVFNDLSLFQLLLIPEIAAFKIFFWSKSNFAFTKYKDSKFSLKQLTPKTLKLSKDVMQLYNSIPGTEFLASEILASMLKQIDFYFIAGYFNSLDDALALCDALVELIAHIKKQAELGCKFLYGESPNPESADYELYYNDLLLVDNTVLVSSAQTNRTYLTSNVVNLLISENQMFYDQNIKWVKNLISKSVLISGAAERDRNKHFRFLFDQIEAIRSKLLLYVNA